LNRGSIDVWLLAMYSFFLFWRLPPSRFFFRMAASVCNTDISLYFPRGFYLSVTANKKKPTSPFFGRTFFFFPFARRFVGRSFFFSQPRRLNGSPKASTWSPMYRARNVFFLLGPLFPGQLFLHVTNLCMAQRPPWCSVPAGEDDSRIPFYYEGGLPPGFFSFCSRDPPVRQSGRRPFAPPPC